MSASRIPTVDEERNIDVIPHMMREMLDYCVASAVESGAAGSLSYDYKTDELVYYLRVTDMDRSIFKILEGITDIWVVTRARSDS